MIPTLRLCKTSVSRSIRLLSASSPRLTLSVDLMLHARARFMISVPSMIAYSEKFMVVRNIHFKAIRNDSHRLMADLVSSFLSPSSLTHWILHQKSLISFRENTTIISLSGQPSDARISDCPLCVCFSVRRLVWNLDIINSDDSVLFFFFFLYFSHSVHVLLSLVIKSKVKMNNINSDGSQERPKSERMKQKICEKNPINIKNEIRIRSKV